MSDDSGESETSPTSARTRRHRVQRAPLTLRRSARLRQRNHEDDPAQTTTGQGQLRSRSPLLRSSTEDHGRQTRRERLAPNTTQASAAIQITSESVPTRNASGDPRSSRNAPCIPSRTRAPTTTTTSTATRSTPTGSSVDDAIVVLGDDEEAVPFPVDSMDLIDDYLELRSQNTSQNTRVTTQYTYELRSQNASQDTRVTSQYTFVTSHNTSQGTSEDTAEDTLSQVTFVTSQNTSQNTSEDTSEDTSAEDTSSQDTSSPGRDYYFVEEQEWWYDTDEVPIIDDDSDEEYDPNESSSSDPDEEYSASLYQYGDENVRKVCVKDELPCPICLDRFKLQEEVGQVPCGHMFHLTCINRWLSTTKTCPLCRMSFPRTRRNVTRPSG